MLRIAILGPSGSGKSTQGKRLARLLGIPYVYTGKELRKLAKENTTVGRKVKSVLDAGDFIRDKELSREIYKKILPEGDFLVDGTPRTKDQLEVFQENYPLTHVIYINVTDSAVVSRLLRRGRHDDNEAAIRNRLSNFRKDAKAIVGAYKKEGILHEVDGSGPKKAVWERIRKIFK